jgi:hypothetical protein
MRQIEQRITITIEPRGDGGLRIWSDELIGLVLSAKDQRAVLLDLGTAIVGLLEHNATIARR